MDLLAATIERQKGWAADFEALIPGIAVNFLYKEETQEGIPVHEWPHAKLVDTIERIESTGVPGMCFFCVGQIEEYGMWETLGRALNR